MVHLYMIYKKKKKKKNSLSDPQKVFTPKVTPDPPTSAITLFAESIFKMCQPPTLLPLKVAPPDHPIRVTTSYIKNSIL